MITTVQSPSLGIEMFVVSILRQIFRPCYLGLSKLVGWPVETYQIGSVASEVTQMTQWWELIGWWVCVGGAAALWGNFTVAALAIGLVGRGGSSIHWSSQAGPGLSGS